MASKNKEIIEQSKFDRFLSSKIGTLWGFILPIIIGTLWVSAYMNNNSNELTKLNTTMNNFIGTMKEYRTTNDNKLGICCDKVEGVENLLYQHGIYPKS